MQRCSTNRCITAGCLSGNPRPFNNSYSKGYGRAVGVDSPPAEGFRVHRCFHHKMACVEHDTRACATRLWRCVLCPPRASGSINVPTTGEMPPSCRGGFTPTASLTLVLGPGSSPMVLWYFCTLVPTHSYFFLACPLLLASLFPLLASALPLVNLNQIPTGIIEHGDRRRLAHVGRRHGELNSQS